MSWPFKPLRRGAHDVLMIDAPWPWATYTAAGDAKSPQRQYDLMTLEDIAALPVRDLLAPGGVAFVWCTWPLIAQQTALVQHAWRLPIRTGGAWAKRTVNEKLRWGPGYVLRSVCEPFLICALPGADTSGGCRLANLIVTIGDAALDGLAREHSRKPDEAYSLLEQLTPGARRADIFARQARPGWLAWGNETTKFRGAA